MAYVRIDVHSIEGYAREATQRVSDVILTSMKTQPGFITCDLVENDTELIAISTWRSKEHATESLVRAAATRDGSAEMNQAPERQYAGQLVTASRAV